MRIFKTPQASLIFSVLAGGTFMFAATPVARVISTDSIDVGGITAPARNFVPVAAGDVITTRSAAAMVQFRDGSSVVVQPNSELRIETQGGRPVAHVVGGSVRYDVVPSSRLRVVNSRGDTINQLLDRALPQATAATSVNSPMAGAFMYRASAAHQAGVVVPGSPISAGQFAFAGSFSPGVGGSGPVIISPTGLRINLVQQGNNFVVSSISVPVVNPVTGQTTFVDVTTSALVGSTITGVSGGIQTGAAVTIGFVPAGSTTPLSGTDVQTALQTGTTTAVNTAITNGQLPPNTPVPGPAPVQTGQFSGSAP